MFAARGVAPLGYAAFAFALGVTAGVLLRRTLPAMAVTLVVFAAVQVLVPVFVRPHVVPPAHFTAPLNPRNNQMVMIGSGNQVTLPASTSPSRRLDPVRPRPSPRPVAYSPAPPPSACLATG